MIELRNNSHKERAWIRNVLYPKTTSMPGDSSNTGVSHKDERTDLLMVDGHGGIRFRTELLKGEDVKIFVRGESVTGEGNLQTLLKFLTLLCDPMGQLILRCAGIRERLKYDVEFRDATFNPDLAETFRTESYQHFRAHIEFDRLSPRAPERFFIGLIESGEILLSNIAETPKGMIYREVYSVLEKDRQEMFQLRNEVIRAADVAECKKSSPGSSASRRTSTGSRPRSRAWNNAQAGATSVISAPRNAGTR